MEPGQIAAPVAVVARLGPGAAVHPEDTLRHRAPRTGPPAPVIAMLKLS